ncbi:hypothetical protein [Shewanella dokdonensis]|uniref:GNAT family N-acetyltransferase n=1 Tax=Shewanella dokdonensis TaxID=712036 RepID=A0ABX8DF91_9GAMM|nr:hypothetical protein [Shewanella dokdonensis]MCL1074971.1 hypothetical protein [Shewanella dokdonensis]QVK23403.1 hypothetical protein KHX94_00965 [Shewanella dokdonensis]
MLKIRAYQQADADEIYRLFYHTVHIVNRRDYTLRQLAAWAPSEQQFTHYLM